MKLIVILMISSSLALAAGVEGPVDPQQLVAANTAFAFNLMNRLEQDQPSANVFVSPYSVSSALQMTANGAAGETKAEMQQTLKTSGMSAPSLNAAFKALDEQLGNRKDVTLNLANGLWVQNGFRIKPAFVDENQKFFRAELANVDFNEPQSAQTINDWTDQKTQGKIKQIVKFPFPPRTRLVLANAIYFKGKWVEPFKKEQTRPREFHLADGQTKQTPMMARQGRFSYEETPDFQAVKLPYNGDLQMELYLPQTNSNPQKLLVEASSNEDWRKGVQTSFRQSEGSVTLPKFKMEYEVALNEPLKTLGIKRAFDADADFSGIADEPLFISQVKQKSYVDVNEEGTEAAAVTAVTVGARAIMMPQKRFVMVLDRPFFFVISDVNSGSILFMGVVNDPTH